MMNRILLAATFFVAGITLSGQSQAATFAAPFFGCKLKAQITHTTSNVELILIRGEKVTGNGSVVCVDAVGQKTTQNVNITIRSGGIGPAFNGSLEGLTIYAARAGITTVDGMAGKYHLSVGPRLGLIHARVGIMGGVQASGAGAGLGVEAVIENRFSVGLDLGGMSLVVIPTTRLHRIR